MSRTPPSRLCLRCQSRHRQHGCDGMCFRCYREVKLGPAWPANYIRPDRDRPATALQREPAAIQEPPLVKRSVIVDGVEYLVSWAGDYEGTTARGIPLER